MKLLHEMASNEMAAEVLDIGLMWHNEMHVHVVDVAKRRLSTSTIVPVNTPKCSFDDKQKSICLH